MLGSGVAAVGSFMALSSGNKVNRYDGSGEALTRYKTGLVHGCEDRLDRPADPADGTVHVRALGLCAPGERVAERGKRQEIRLRTEAGRSECDAVSRLWAVDFERLATD